MENHKIYIKLFSNKSSFTKKNVCFFHHYNILYINKIRERGINFERKNTEDLLKIFRVFVGIFRVISRHLPCFCRKILS